MHSRNSEPQSSALGPRSKTLFMIGFLALVLSMIPWVDWPYGELDWVASGQPYETTTPTATMTATMTTTSTPTVTPTTTGIPTSTVTPTATVTPTPAGYLPLILRSEALLPDVIGFDETNVDF